MSLGLPKIEPRPPCPPRIYQKLYKHLDSALTAGTRRSGRPARNSANTTPTSSPIKPRTPAKPTPLRPATARRKGTARASIAQEVPRWVLPTIRHLCKALGAPAAPHHVFAGVSSILTLPAPRSSFDASSNDDSNNGNIASLIIVVYLLVITRLSGREMPAAEFIRLRGLAITSIYDSGIPEASEQVADTDEAVTDVVNWMRDIGAQGWTELDWFANFGEGIGLGIAEAQAMDEVDGGSEVDVNHRSSESLVGHVDLILDDEDQNVLRPGLGTMVSSTLDLNHALVTTTLCDYCIF